MMEMDRLMYCVYCGRTQTAFTKAQLKAFGKPTCCEYLMAEMDRNKIYAVVKALEELKRNLEAEIVAGL